MSDDAGAAVESGESTGRQFPDTETVARYLQWGTLAVLVIFALVAAANFYSNVGRIIQVWVASEYQPVFSAAFNLLVLLVAAAGISLLIRRLDREA